MACYPVPDTGVFLYFRSCLGDSVKFVAKGVYPENGTTYTQHDTLHTFHWLFGDGTSAVTDTNVVWHVYDSAKGYDASMFIVDTNRCEGIPNVYRVTVTQNPINYLKPLPEKCIGDTSVITATTFTAFTPYSYSQTSSQKFDSVMFIPDGPNCDPENPCYNTEVFFTSFLPSQTITSASDILSICVMMEHSYVGDMGFHIVCPNGQRARLKKYIHWGGADMGIRGLPDQGCKPAENGIGTPWNYCWSEIYPNDSTINFNAGVARLDSTDRVNNLHYYLPDSALSTLIGCPLNGSWSIEICDYWGTDNGYIFEWTMNLSPALLPQAWGYEAAIDSTWVEGPFIVGSQGGSTLICPTETGLFEYSVFFQDDFGCVWDTSLMLQVNPVPAVDLGPDTTFCSGITHTLSAGLPPNTFLWSTAQTTPTIQVTTGGQYTVTVTSPDACTSSDTIIISVVPLPAPKSIRHE